MKFLYWIILKKNGKNCNKWKMKTKTIIPYFGGKSWHIDWLKSLFPPAGVSHFIDAMCGSAVVSINVNYPFVTINDINEDVFNFFQVLRNHYNEFRKQIIYTPYCRQEFDLCAERTGEPVEDARRFYVRAVQGYGANTSQNTHKGWTSNTNPDLSNNYFKPYGWAIRHTFLDDIVEKLRKFQIEKLDVFELIKKYDKKHNFLYLDPPYVRATRCQRNRYRHEFSDDDHIKLMEHAISVKNARVAISGYESDIYDQLSTAGWYDFSAPPSRATVAKKLVQEKLWTNYFPVTTLNLF